MERRHEAGEHGDLTIRLIDLMKHFPHVQRGEGEHRYGDQQHQEPYGGTEPRSRGERERAQDGEDDKRRGLEVDTEDQFLAFLRALRLPPFQDVFIAGGEHAEIEALLSVLSTGPVGVGDRLGRADAEIVRRTCRADGVLVKPDFPIAAVDRAFLQHGVARPEPLIAETASAHTAGTWTYVLTINAFRQGDPVTSRVDLRDVGVTEPVVAFDWRAGTAEPLDPGGGWDVALPAAGWDYRLLAPLRDDVAVIGDANLFAPAGDMRIGDVDGRRVTVLGAPGERVTLTVWDGELRTIDVDVPDRGWLAVDVRR